MRESSKNESENFTKRLDLARKIVEAAKEPQLTTEEPSNSTNQAEAQKARFTALKYIGIDKGKSSGKVRQKLRDEGFSEDVIEETISTLIKDDYLSDYRACARITRRHQGSKLKSARYMVELYKELGVSPQVAEEYSADLPDDQESLVILLSKEQAPASEREKARIIRRLAGRGFSIYSIQKAMEDILQ